MAEITAALGEPYFTDGTVSLFCGDSMELLPQISGVSAVVTDPPYSINTKSDGMGKLSPWADLCNAALFYTSWIGECRRALRDDGCLWSCLNWRSLPTFQKASCDLRWPVESLLVWDKCWIGPGGVKGLRPSYELVALWAKEDFAIKNRGLADVQRFKWCGKKPHHPAEKPVDLMSWLIDTVPVDGVVLDPFAGSGSTLVAARKRGRAAIGIELDPQNCEIAANRLRQGQLELTATDG